MLEINPASGKKRRGAEILQIAANGEPKTVENAVIVPETDPERVAFHLWNEGKVDEAIQYLEREILSRKERYEGQDGTVGPTLLADKIPGGLNPISDWRDRHRALGAADFNAFGSSAHTIDLVAGPADAIVPHPPRRRLRPIWIMGICLAVIGVSSAAAFWSTRAGAPEETALAAVERTLVKEPAAKPAAAPKPTPYIASVGADHDTTPTKPVAATARDTDAEAADTPPPDEAAPNDLASDETAAPETTASIPATASTEASEGIETTPPVVEARLPRQRPEPPAQAQPARVAHVDQQDPPTVYTPPQSNDAAPPFFDPNNPPPRLTPAEYQALLERRAWAENYVAKRRAYAERRARLEEPDGWLGSPGPFVRLQDD